MVAVAVLSVTSVFATTVGYMDPASEVFDRMKLQTTLTPDLTNPAATMPNSAAGIADYTLPAVGLNWDAASQSPTVTIAALDKNDATSLLWFLNGGQSQISLLRVEVLRKTQQDPAADAPEIMTLVMIGSGLALFSLVKLRRRPRSHGDDYREVLKRTAMIAATRS